MKVVMGMRVDADSMLWCYILQGTVLILGCLGKFYSNLPFYPFSCHQLQGRVQMGILAVKNKLLVRCCIVALWHVNMCYVHSIRKQLLSVNVLLGKKLPHKCQRYHPRYLGCDGWLGGDKWGNERKCNLSVACSVKWGWEQMLAQTYPLWPRVCPLFYLTLSAIKVSTWGHSEFFSG